jgi:hypothetical protein
VDDYKYYVRDEAETTLAVRDELVALVRETVQGQPASRPTQNGRKGRNGRPADLKSEKRAEPKPANNPESKSESKPAAPPSTGNRRSRGRNRGGERHSYSAAAPNSDVTKPLVLVNRTGDVASSNLDETVGNMPGILPPLAIEAGREDAFYLPQIGVEIVATELRNGNHFHSIHDLRNGHVIHNVTRRGARKLWSYAIQQHEDNAVKPDAIQWQGEIGLVHTERRAGKVRYDLALREGNGKTRIFYGVTDDGMEGRWAAFVQEE